MNNYLLFFQWPLKDGAYESGFIFSVGWDGIDLSWSNLPTSKVAIIKEQQRKNMKALDYS